MKTVREIELENRKRMAAVRRLHRLPWNANFKTLGYAFCIRILGPQHVGNFLLEKRIRESVAK